jgi:alpha-N-arabinofuranosidase
LVAFQNETHSFFLGVRLSQQGQRTIFLEMRNGDVSQVASESLPGDAPDVALKVEGAGASYRFFYRVEGQLWKQLVVAHDGTILSTKEAGGFVGAYIGMFARLSRN